MKIRSLILPDPSGTFPFPPQRAERSLWEYSEPGRGAFVSIEAEETRLSGVSQVAPSRIHETGAIVETNQEIWRSGDMTMTTRLIALLAVMAFVVTACGSASADVATLQDDVASLGGEASRAGDAAEVDEEAALLAFAQCLREEGLDVEDPVVDEEGNIQPPRPVQGGQAIDREAFQAAREACEEFLDGVTLGFGDVDQTELEDQLLEFSTCLRDQGLEVDDPNLSGGPGAGRGLFGDLDPDDPVVQAALEACEEFLPGGGFRGGGPGQGGNG